MRHRWLHPEATVEEGAHVGTETRIWRHVYVGSGAHVGDRCSLGQRCYVGGKASIGSGSRLQNDVFVCDGVTLEAGVFCGPGVTFTNVRRPRAFINQRDRFSSTRVGEGATLGARATILPGVTIGRYALVGAGAVVTRDVPAFAEVVGNPAQQRGWVSRLGAPLHFEGDEATCRDTGDRYALASDIVTLVREGPLTRALGYRGGIE